MAQRISQIAINTRSGGSIQFDRYVKKALIEVTKMAGVLNTLYTAVFKRSSTFTLAIIAGSFIFERSVDLFSDNLYKSINKGKLWDDIKHKYEH